MGIWNEKALHNRSLQSVNTCSYQNLLKFTKLNSHFCFLRSLKALPYFHLGQMGKKNSHEFQKSESPQKKNKIIKGGYHRYFDLVDFYAGYLSWCKPPRNCVSS